MTLRSTGAASLLTVACVAGLVALVNVGVAFGRRAPGAVPAVVVRPLTPAEEFLALVRGAAVDPVLRVNLAAEAPDAAKMATELMAIAADPVHPMRREAIFALRFVPVAAEALHEIAESAGPNEALLAQDSLEAMGEGGDEVKGSW